jgi:hypothetical protein
LAVALLKKRRHGATVVESGRRAVELVRGTRFDLVLAIVTVIAQAIEATGSAAWTRAWTTTVSKPIAPAELEGAFELRTEEPPDFEHERVLERVTDAV